MELQTIVNKNDRIIGYKKREDITFLDIYRVSAVIPIDQEGNIYLGKRALTKKNNPGLIAPLVNGTVGKGETYRANAIKETFEEIGLKIKNVKKIGKCLINKKPYIHFLVLYGIKIDNNTSFKIDKNEISEVKKLSIEEATIYYQNNPDRFIPSFDKILKLINKKMKLFN